MNKADKTTIVQITADFETLDCLTVYWNMTP